MIGRKRERIVIQRRSAAADTLGDINAETWATYATLWAGIKAIRGREFTSQDRTTGEISHRFFVRYSATTAGINTDDRLVYRSENHDIVSAVDIDGRKREIEIATKLRT